MRPDRFPLAAVYVALAVLGAVLALWAAFLVPARVWGLAGIADVIALGGNFVAGMLGAWGAGTVAAAAMPGVGWVVATVTVVGVARPSDEVVLPGRLDGDPAVVTVGTLFLFGGLVGAILAVVLAGRFTRDGNPPTSDQ